MPPGKLQIPRLGLRGGRESTVDVAAASQGGTRIREAVVAALQACAHIQEVPMMHASNVVCLKLPDPQQGTEGADVQQLLLKVAHQCPDIEVTRGAKGEPELHQVGTELATKLHRLLLTEFLLKDSLGGHAPSSFTTSALEAECNPAG